MTDLRYALHHGCPTRMSVKNTVVQGHWLDANDSKELLVYGFAHAVVGCGDLQCFICVYSHLGVHHIVSQAF